MNQEKIWEYFQSHSKGSFDGSIGRLSAVVRLVDRGQQVLNIGVGAGTFEDFAIKKGIDVYSLDLSQKSIAEISARFGLGDKARAGSASAIPFPDDMFDVVVMSEVIEHIPTGELEHSLKEVRRVLKPGGRLIGTVPSKEDLSKDTVVCPCCGERFHRWGHMQSFDTQKVREVLQRIFDVKCVERRFLPSWSAMDWKAKLETCVLIVFRMLGAELANEHIFFVAAKASR